MSTITIAGVDEVGRGALAGPVVACVLSNLISDMEVNDSKALTEKRRERISSEIRLTDAIFSIGECSHDEIDQINIHNATLKAMQRAIDGLKVVPSKIYIDGLFVPALINHVGALMEPIIKGDQKIKEIMAASILAKVYRDNIMKGLHDLYPQYGFNENKGYGTKRHLTALKAIGPCPMHRLTFSGVLL